ncbi:DUF3558 family protein [Gordonia sp. NPDC003429]
MLSFITQTALVQPIFVRERSYSFWLFLGISLSGFLSGCSMNGTPVTQSTTGIISTTKVAIRQTDSEGRRLPFDTKFPDRWNTGNDGTPYEPCTAIRDSVLRTAGVNPSTAEDAALANYQTLRGCMWRYEGTRHGFISQVVANSEPLAEYKKRQSVIIRWFPNTSINGRTVAVGAFQGPKRCLTIVDTGRSHVTTSVAFR